MIPSATEYASFIPVAAGKRRANSRIAGFLHHRRWWGRMMEEFVNQDLSIRQLASANCNEIRYRFCRVTDDIDDGFTLCKLRLPKINRFGPNQSGMSDVNELSAATARSLYRWAAQGWAAGAISNFASAVSKRLLGSLAQTGVVESGFGARIY